MSTLTSKITDCPTCASIARTDTLASITTRFASSDRKCGACGNNCGKPSLLDLFSGGGGAARGYQRAGFCVLGVDLEAQPRYIGCRFLQADALEYLAKHSQEYDAIHASPPCQAYTSLRKMWNSKQHPDLVSLTWERLKATGVPWVMENVVGAPFGAPIILCGSMFRLGCEGAELRRHRLFETSFPLMSPSACVHGWSGKAAETIGVYGHAGGYSLRQRYATIGVYGGHGRDRRRRKNGQHFSTALRAEAMGIDWMTGAELSQAIPPAYTTWIGRMLLQELARK